MGDDSNHKMRDFLAGQGEMARRTRDFDWSKTSLGPVDKWPQSLRSAVSMLLPSKAQIVLFWGPDLITLYNDAYRPVFGAKHPAVLGLPARDAWSEIWLSGLKDLFEGVLTTGEAFWASDRLFLLERNGYPEETYFDVSYDPVRDETGAVGGVFCIVSETTGRVVGERRLKTLRELGSGTTAEATSPDKACQNAARVLAANPHDLPFGLIYLLDADASSARIAGAAGLEAGSPAAPDAVDLAAHVTGVAWPFRSVLETGHPEVVTDLSARFGALPPGTWSTPPHTAVVLPIIKSGQDRLAGFLVAGISPRRALDDQYRAFLDLMANQIATAIANARAYEEEQRRAQALADLDRAKTAFFSNISHEFRTPLTLMLGPVEDLLVRNHAELPPAVIRQLEVVNRSGTRLLRLVNTLLDFSRIEAGRTRAVYQPTQIAAFTAELASVFRATVERAGLQLAVDCREPSQLVFVDRDMWEKIVLNLLSNAFKFTFDGEIAVTLQQQGDSVELRVRDTGTGIPPQEMPKIFERFHRVQNARGRTHEGSGIGLAFVQELVKLHGGSVQAESVVDRGSTFIVRIPLGSKHLPQDQIAEERATVGKAPGADAYVEEALHWFTDESDSNIELPRYATSLSTLQSQRDSKDRARVLVADDNADMRQYLQHLLAKAYQVKVVADGEAALAYAREQPPHLILTDVMMPRLDGFGLLRELRADPRTRDLPVVMLSARAGEESRVEGLRAGADDYLIKPFSARELLARVHSCLELARVRNEATQALRESDHRKDVFLATLAHELRGPLAPIRNMLEIMKRADGNAQLVERARSTMERQLGSLVRLVDDLLDVSRITRGKMELRKETVELASIIHHACETSRPLGLQHELSVKLPPEPIYVDADPVRLVQVFGNLLNNAFKYTEPNGHVSLTVERRGDEVLVKITDSGIGIPPEKLASIFEMFTQVDGTLERSQGGLGIGLALARRLLEMHGGTVEAHSEGRGKGSEFMVRLPVIAAVTNPVLASSDVQSTQNGVCRILVVDDNVDSASSLCILLRMTGHETHVAHDGLEAVESAQRLRPDAVLLDIGMPKLNGYDACRHIRNQPWGQDMVLIALTGWGQEADRQKSQAAGFDGHLTKPVDHRLLVQMLDSRLSARKGVAKASDPGAALTT